MSESASKRRRTTYWTNTQLFPPLPVPGTPKIVPSGLTADQKHALLVRIRLEEIAQKMLSNKLEHMEEHERSPSPEPIYDGQGKRLNTRDQRLRDKGNKDRQILVQKAMSINPAFRPPSDYVPPSSKKSRRVHIPQKEHPEYNFIGLIIGPRGNTQKRMERETGAKIVIRGKGSQKEGKGVPQPGADEELHVLVTADTEDQLDKAVEMIQQLLVPVDEGKNEHKRAQLRELAEINGTLRDRSWMNLEEENNWEAADVYCAICGEVSHPTADCPFKGNSTGGATKSKALTSEYDAFLSEIGEAPLPTGDAPTQIPKTQPKTQDSYADFMNQISQVESKTKNNERQTSSSLGKTRRNWNSVATRTSNESRI